ncbi:hypothetical protein HF521_002431 [Silurus meridionalis]|uniref:Inositol polyphosphate-related phosphatase domain-containing protein n=1 Tax=Silurus meridionalis TaxID=175797 RepID=A0A8T0B951_SILME|nr:hypothetical protein HF521_002431 [Silurus meridionalis]
MATALEGTRARSDSNTSTRSSRMYLRQSLLQLLTCVEDLSSGDEAAEEVSRTLDKAFQLCGRQSREFFSIGRYTARSDSNTSTRSSRMYLRQSLLQLLTCVEDLSSGDEAAEEVSRTLDKAFQLCGRQSREFFSLQEVRATPVKYMSDLIAEDSWSHLFMDTLMPNGFVKVTSVRMQGLLLLLFAKQVHLPFIRDIQTTYTRTGFFGYWCGVWFGDLNFRIADHGLHFLRSIINSGRFSLLWEKDQLTMMKKMEPLLQEFEEGPLEFKPTYKFSRFSEAYDMSPEKTWLGFTGKKRRPAWTDRILWRVKAKGSPDEEESGSTSSSSSSAAAVDKKDFSLRVNQQKYTCDTSYGVSDHKPVIATFILETNFKSPTDYITFVWVKEGEFAEINDVVQLRMNKDDFPVLAGDYILGYYSRNMQSLVGLSPTFQIMESRLALLEHLMPENVNGLQPQ